MRLKPPQASQIKVSSFQTSAESKKHLSAEPLNDRYTEISSFCDSTRKLLTEYESNIEYMQGPHSHYLEQEQLIEEFHNGMVEYLNQVKSQHLKMLKAESRKYLQIADIERGEAEENANELHDILNDIEGNINDIVGALSEDRYREVMNCY